MIAKLNEPFGDQIICFCLILVHLGKMPLAELGQGKHVYLVEVM